MFANILRTQVRLALTCRTRVPVFSISRVAARSPSVTIVLPTLRAISTSRPVWNADYLGGNAESNTLYVGNLPYNVTEEEISDKFGAFGEIKAVRLAYESSGRTRGFAHVEYVDVHDAVAAYKSIQEEPIYLLDRDLRVDYAATRARNDPSNTLYFHGFRGSRDDMREIAKDFEESITHVFLLRDRESGIPNGAGFIHFTSIARAEEALHALDGRSYGDGNDVVRIRFAAPKNSSRRRRE